MNSVGLTGDVPDASALRGAITPWRVAWLLAAVVGLVVCVWPLGMAGDYMNHLARNHIEARVWFDPVIQQNYTISFRVIPDLAMDLVVPWLSHLIGTYAAGAVMTWLAFVLPPLAGLVVAQTLYGRIGWVSLLGFMTVFNQNMQWGFVNFTLSTGLALLGFAFWIRSPLTWLRVAALAGFGVFLAFNHALGFMLFGYIVLLWEIGCFATGRRAALRDFLLLLVTKGAVAMIPGLLVIIMSLDNGSQLPQTGLVRFALDQKIDALWSATAFFDGSLSRLATILVVCLFWLGLRKGFLRIDPPMAWVCGGLLALVLAMPTTFMGIWGLHFRYPAVLVILAAASVRVVPGHRRVTGQIAAVASLLLVVLYANAALQISRIDALANQRRELFSHLPEGARVLPASHEETNPLLTLHAASMAVIERSAYVPNLFTNTSPVGVRPQMRPLHMPQAWTLFESQLVEAAALNLPPSANGFWSPDYYHGWPRHWDYVVYFRKSPDQSLDLPHLCPQHEIPGAVLYRVAAAGC